MKYFRMSYEEVVFQRSYLNLLLLNRAIPSIKPYSNEEDDDKEENANRRNKPNQGKVVRHKIKEKCAADFFMKFM